MVQQHWERARHLALYRTVSAIAFKTTVTGAETDY